MKTLYLNTHIPLILFLLQVSRTGGGNKGKKL